MSLGQQLSPLEMKALAGWAPQGLGIATACGGSARVPTTDLGWRYLARGISGEKSPSSAGCAPPRCLSPGRGNDCSLKAVDNPAASSVFPHNIPAIMMPGTR